MYLRTRWYLAMAAAGLGLVGWLGWAVEHTEPPPLPVLVADLIAVLGLAIMPWLVIVGRQLVRVREGERLMSRVVVSVLILAVAGPVLGMVALRISGEQDSLVPLAITMMSMAVAGVIALVGGVLMPGVVLLARTVARERSARVRAEERAEVAAHLHDSVLQALTLIQKRADDSRSVRQLARSSERELRVWLYGAAPSAAVDDLAAAVRAVCEEIEDRFDVAVELVTVGTGPLDGPALAVLGAVREALTNAGKHAGVRQVSAFVEAADGELLALVRDRGRGFDPALVPAGRRGIADSIEARLRQHGGTAQVRAAVGAGVEVELRVAR
jgi:signal transduction histidine kinase